MRAAAVTSPNGARDETTVRPLRTAESLRDVNEQLVLAVVDAQQHLEDARHALQWVERMAEHDPLTGLASRALLQDRFGQAASLAQRHGRLMAILFLDLNHFKRVNDELGHAAGDAVLRLVGQVLGASVRMSDTVSRYGGDEFVVLLTDLVCVDDASVLAEKLCRALESPLHIGDQVVHVSASCGVSIFPDHGVEPKALIALADAAMYAARRAGQDSVAMHRVGELAAPPIGVQRSAIGGATVGVPDDFHASLREANEKLVLAALTAQELHADAQQAQRRQTEFMAVLAHELRTPLAPIRNVSALLERLTVDDPMLPRLKAIIERQVDHMARLVDDLLDVSRAITGKLRLQLEVVSMAAVVHEAVAASQPGIELRRQTFTLELPLVEVTVLGDSLRLVQVIGNLLDNASKYTPNGGAISLAMTADDHEMTLTVQDSGIGITAAALPGVFGLFAQDVHAVGYNGVGLGIGLTVVHELVQAHGGTVTAHSLGATQGSQFVVTLPLVPRSLDTLPTA